MSAPTRSGGERGEFGQNSRRFQIGQGGATPAGGSHPDRGGAGGVLVLLRGESLKSVIFHRMTQMKVLPPAPGGSAGGRGGRVLADLELWGRWSRGLCR